MPALRQSLKRPETYLAALFILAGLGVLDSYRSPAKQITGHLYINGVQLYQTFGRPLLKNHIECRYSPTCSEYSMEAVRKYGIRRGLALTFARLQSCTKDVPPGTYDPLPQRQKD
jgi:putative membrane protein insertion efficiency factor